VLVAGGQGTNGFLSSAELYDPATNTWSATGSLATTRVECTATLLQSGQVVVAGGEATGGAILRSAEIYTLASAVVASVPALPTWAVLVLAAGLLAVTSQRLRRRGLASTLGV
jgi:Kelch motif